MIMFIIIISLFILFFSTRRRQNSSSDFQSWLSAIFWIRHCLILLAIRHFFFFFPSPKGP